MSTFTCLLGNQCITAVPHGFHAHFTLCEPICAHLSRSLLWQPIVSKFLFLGRVLGPHLPAFHPAPYFIQMFPCISISVSLARFSASLCSPTSPLLTLPQTGLCALVLVAGFVCLGCYFDLVLLLTVFGACCLGMLSVGLLL